MPITKAVIAAVAPLSAAGVAGQPRRSKVASLFVALAVLIVLMQAVQLVRRASWEASDFGVFYQTATMLQQGAGGEIYDLRDQKPGWPRCIPPAGTVLLQPLAWFDSGAAGVVWALLNLGLLATAVAALREFIGKLDRHRLVYQSAFVWAVILFLVLSTGSIQVGQLSLLFVCCWVFYLYAAANGWGFWAGLALAIPGAIKLYPVLMLAVPLSTGKRREVLWFGAGLLLVCAVIPFAVYGPRTWDLTTSFLHNVILNPQGRISLAQTLIPGNQGLDAVLLRYLSCDPKFHHRHSEIPHLNLAREQVLHLANALRLLVLVVSAAVIVRWRRRVRDSPLYAVLQMAAFWSATLYLILPETKARYAVYAFLGFLPLIAAATEARMQGNRLRHAALCGLTVFCLVLVLSLTPHSLRVLGLGFIGAFALWVANIRFLTLENELAGSRAPTPCRTLVAENPT